ncbi:MAG: DNA topoisomerase IV subunit B, partial [Myxococcota bacterium]
MTDSYVGIALRMLDEVEAVRKRPGMYVGSSGPLGVAHLVFELVGAGVARHRAGEVTALGVQLAAPGITVTDDGPG